MRSCFCPFAQAAKRSWLHRKRSSGRISTVQPRAVSQPAIISFTRHSLGSVKTTRSG